MMDLLLSPQGIAAALALVLAGAVQGSTGFGFNMLAAPMLAIIDAAFVPGPMLAMAIAVSAGGMVREWRDVSRQDLAFSLTGRLLAAGAAAFCLQLLSPDAFAAVFGLGVLFAVALSLLGLKIETTRRSLFFAGVLSGFMGTLTSIGAPPMAMVYQNTGGARMRATLNAFFVVGGVISIAALFVAGSFGSSDLLLAGTMLPFAVLGFLLSGWGRRLVDRGHVKLVVLVVSAASGLVLLLRAFS
ncbi:sulfite exporter TauE/SafE family protein (plasmid) [Sinorhizobium medicae]|uniref:sulfite exporter TauE/SafE family protein n=1 Tax=Sinorhizobium medicae TaxID=110321 RepID=UPI002AF6B14D|nr:sulfite exporter TauE/SafE family protein [Sinorhizobium medicae]WQO47728.1 sulfite exporter TauE/SafE family protein [Sinorhizobium medicae]WQO94334.1 sulfite exporter TauE/SafE family protein [Sinorhizobium medicae]